MIVQVFNDNVHPYRERFRDQDIYIPAGKSIKMEMGDAHLFLGVMPPHIEVDANEKIKPTSYKMLRIAPLGDEKPEAAVTGFKCMIDGKEFPTQRALDDYIAENHADSIVDEESRDKFKKERNKKG